MATSSSRRRRDRNPALFVDVTTSRPRKRQRCVAAPRDDDASLSASQSSTASSSSSGGAYEEAAATPGHSPASTFSPQQPTPVGAFPDAPQRKVAPGSGGAPQRRSSRRRRKTQAMQDSDVFEADEEGGDGNHVDTAFVDGGVNASGKRESIAYSRRRRTRQSYSHSHHTERRVVMTATGRRPLGGSRSERTRGRTTSTTTSRRNLPQRTIDILKAWVLHPRHVTHPYPSEQEKEELAATCDIEMKQLTNWFTNARKRMWAPMMRQIGKEITSVNNKSHVEVLTKAEQQAVMERAGVTAAALRVAVQAELAREEEERKSAQELARKLPPQLRAASAAPEQLGVHAHRIMHDGDDDDDDDDDSEDDDSGATRGGVDKQDVDMGARRSRSSHSRSHATDPHYTGRPPLSPNSMDGTLSVDTSSDFDDADHGFTRRRYRATKTAATATAAAAAAGRFSQPHKGFVDMTSRDGLLAQPATMFATPSQAAPSTQWPSEVTSASSAIGMDTVDVFTQPNPSTAAARNRELCASPSATVPMFVDREKQSKGRHAGATGTTSTAATSATGATTSSVSTSSAAATISSSSSSSASVFGSTSSAMTSSGRRGLRRALFVGNDVSEDMSLTTTTTATTTHYTPSHTSHNAGVEDRCGSGGNTPAYRRRSMRPFRNPSGGRASRFCMFAGLENSASAVFAADVRSRRRSRPAWWWRRFTRSSYAYPYYGYHTTTEEDVDPTMSSSSSSSHASPELSSFLLQLTA